MGVQGGNEGVVQAIWSKQSKATHDVIRGKGKLLVCVRPQFPSELGHNPHFKNSNQTDRHIESRLRALGVWVGLGRWGTEEKKSGKTHGPRLQCGDSRVEGVVGSGRGYREDEW